MRNGRIVEFLWIELHIKLDSRASDSHSHVFDLVQTESIPRIRNTRFNAIGHNLIADFIVLVAGIVISLLKLGFKRHTLEDFLFGGFRSDGRLILKLYDL